MNNRAFLALAAVAVAAAATEKYRDWTTYGGGPEVMRYSSLNQITRKNVNDLKVAWTFDFEDSFQGSQIQATPLMVNNVLYAISPRSKVAALDAATGQLIWKFDPTDGAVGIRGGSRTRGVNYWTDGKEARVFAVYQQHLYALDAKTGKPIPSFGERGHIDLRQGFDRPPETLSVSLSTPGVVYKDLLIIGSIVAEDLPSAPGDIRAIDVRTGKICWTFHTVPHPGEFGYETWPKDAWKHTGGANDWSGMALDERRGMVFVPTGSAAFDFYAADRHGDNLFANSLLALKADTGERVWHYQFVKHDVWDRDLPAAPSLVTLKRNGKRVDAVAQITKSGHVWLFERENGKPVFPIEQRKVPPSDVEGELLPETQPLPSKPPAFARQEVTEDMLTKRTPEAHEAVLKRFRTLRSGPQFTPPSLQGTIFMPGLDGGGTWGGAAFDPDSGLLYVNANEMPWILQLGLRRPGGGRRSSAIALYRTQCAACHGVEMKGSPPDLPPLTGIASRRTEAEIKNVIRKGVGRMPSFAGLTDEAVDALVRYISAGEDRELIGTSRTPGPALKYSAAVNSKFLDPDGYPAITPPWGTLNAIDLNAGEIRWQVPLGEVPELVAKGIKNTGTQNFGGPIVTAGGLVFIGATTYDEKFRAFDKKTGELVWETKLPAGNFSTPAMYQVNGKQFIVVPAGGGRGRPSSAKYVAFALQTTQSAALNSNQDLRGVVDLHAHSDPDSLPRSIDAIDLAKLAAAKGMRALVLKNHYESTASLAYLARKQVPGIELFGGIALNQPVGGVNPAAVERMTRVKGGWGRVVWMPTFDAGVVPVSRDGKLLPSVNEVLDLIAKHQLTLATGHSKPEEGLMLIRAAKAKGINRILVTHGMLPPVSMTISQMKEAARLGAKIEFVYNALTGPTKVFEVKQYVDAIREVGPENCVLSSDLGQPGNPLHPDGFLAFLKTLKDAGFTTTELDLMSKTNPAALLGLN